MTLADQSHQWGIYAIPHHAPEAWKSLVRVPRCLRSNSAFDLRRVSSSSCSTSFAASCYSPSARFRWRWAVSKSCRRRRRAGGRWFGRRRATRRSITHQVPQAPLLERDVSKSARPLQLPVESFLRPAELVGRRHQDCPSTRNLYALDRQEAQGPSLGAGGPKRVFLFQASC